MVRFQTLASYTTYSNAGTVSKREFPVALPRTLLGELMQRSPDPLGSGWGAYHNTALTKNLTPAQPFGLRARLASAIGGTTCDIYVIYIGLRAAEKYI